LGVSRNGKFWWANTMRHEQKTPTKNKILKILL
jgi:hypothetical protein